MNKLQHGSNKQSRCFQGELQRHANEKAGGFGGEGGDFVQAVRVGMDMMDFWHSLEELGEGSYLGFYKAFPFPVDLFIRADDIQLDIHLVPFEEVLLLKQYFPTHALFLQNPLGTVSSSSNLLDQNDPCGLGYIECRVHHWRNRSDNGHQRFGSLHQIPTISRSFQYHRLRPRPLSKNAEKFPENFLGGITSFLLAHIGYQQRPGGSPQESKEIGVNSSSFGPQFDGT